jgi:hypothetical protein
MHPRTGNEEGDFSDWRVPPPTTRMLTEKIAKLRGENERLRKAAQDVLKHGAIDEDCHYIRELAAALSGPSESADE